MAAARLSSIASHLSASSPKGLLAGEVAIITVSRSLAALVALTEPSYSTTGSRSGHRTVLRSLVRRRRS